MRLANEMQQDRRTLLITGAAGFLGAQAVEKALHDGYRVVAVVRPRGEDGRAETSELSALRMKYRDALTIEKVNLEDKASVGELIARHPEVDSVLHAAAVVRPKHGEEDAVQRMNVDATITLARACETLAEQRQKPIQFHFVSSISALYHEQQTVPQHNGAVAAEAYGKSKCDASHWLCDHAKELPHLDVSITYPPAIIGPVPSTAWISQVVRMGQANDKGFELAKADKAEAITRMVHSANYLQDVFACLNAPISLGVKEYSVVPDYELQVGELVRVAKQMVIDKRLNAPHDERDLNEQAEMDFSLRHLPTVSEALGAPKHQRIRLYDVLAAQYDAIARQKTSMIS